jgi:hypothetical protein
VPDVTLDELGELFKSKLPSSTRRGVENQNGFLIAAVARSCTPAAIDAIRQSREVPKENPHWTIHSSELEQLLDDPNTPADMKKFIEDRLRERS